MNQLTDKIKIIVADDHPVFRGGMVVALKSMSFVTKISQAAHGDEVIRLLEHEPYDLVLMDIKMAPMDGIEATEIIQARYPKTKVIAMSMHDDEKNIISILEKGAEGYLIKNADKEEIEEAIIEVISGREYFSKEVSRVIFQKLIHSGDKALTVKSEELLQKERCREIVFLICNELTNQEIADVLFLSKRTIEDYRKQILVTTKSKNIVGVVRYALSTGILEDNELKKKFKGVVGER